MPQESPIKKLVVELENTILSPEAPENVLITGRQGWGKREIMRILASELRKKDMITLEGRTEASVEVEKYEPFNQILNSVTGSIKIRELGEILRESNDHFSDGVRRFLFLTNINLLSDPTRYLLTYFMKNSSKFNITIICSCSTDTEIQNGDLSGFLEIVAGERLSKVFTLGKPTFDDFIYVLEKYTFPLEFSMNLYRLTDANFMILDYVIKYYTVKGMISSSGELDYRVYRFFVIPREISAFLTSVVSGMSMEQKMTLSLVSFSETFMPPSLIGELLGFEEKTAGVICKDLSEMGIVMELSSNYGITSRFLNQFLSREIPEDILLTVIAKVKESRKFHELPVENRIKFLEKLNDLDGLSSLIKKEWRSFIRKFTDVRSTLSFVRRAQEKIKDQETNRILSLIRCNAIYNGDNLEQARKCYETGFAFEVDPIGVTLTLASIYQSLNRFEKSIEILEQLEGMDEVEKGPLGFSHLLKAEAYFNGDNFEKCLEEAGKALAYGEEISDAELTARALTVLGNERFITGKNEEAETFYRRSIELNRSLGIWLQISRNLNNLSALLEREGRYGESMNCLSELIDNTYLTGDSTLRASAFHNMARLMDFDGRRSEVIEFAEKCISTSRIIRSQELVMRSYSLIFWHNIRDLSLSRAINSLNEALKEPPNFMTGYFESVGRLLGIMDGGPREPSYDDLKLPDVPDEFDRLQYGIMALLAAKIAGLKSDGGLSLNTILNAMENGSSLLKEIQYCEPEYISRRLNHTDHKTSPVDTIPHRLFEILYKAFNNSGEPTAVADLKDSQRFIGLVSDITRESISFLDGKLEAVDFLSYLKTIWVE